MGPEARAWVHAAEAGQAEPDVAHVAVSAIRHDYGRAARLLLGWAMVGPLVVSVSLVVLFLRVLQSDSIGAESGSIYGGVFFVALLVAAASGTTVLLLQRSGRRLTRAAAAWIRAGLAEPAPRHPVDGDPGETDWSIALAARVAYLVLSGVSIGLCVCLMFWFGDSEGGAAIAPLAAAIAVQLLIAAGVTSGMLRLRASSAAYKKVG
jgi:hypothetical protein